MPDSKVIGLRTVHAFDDYAKAGKSLESEWMRHALLALRQPGSLDILEVSEVAPDGEIFQAFAMYKGDRQKLLKKAGCPLYSAVQAEAHLVALLGSKPKSAWDREDTSHTGKIDHLNYGALCSNFWYRYGLLLLSVLFIWFALALAGFSTWMRLKNKYLVIFHQHLWAWPHFFPAAAFLGAVGLVILALNYCLYLSCCRRCCTRCPCIRCCCCCCYKKGNLSFCHCFRCCCCRRREETAVRDEELGSNSSPTNSPANADAQQHHQYALPPYPNQVSDSDLALVALPDPANDQMLQVQDSGALDRISMMSRSTSFETLRSPYAEITWPGESVQPGNTSSSLKNVTFETDAEGYEDLVQPLTLTAMSPPATPIVEPIRKGPPPAPQRAIVDSSISALWHDPAYSFASRCAKDAAKAAAEAAHDPRFGTMGDISGSQVEKSKTYLSQMVVDTAVHGVEQELRPHMVQFYQDTTFQSDPRYPNWHPGSIRCREEQDNLSRCERKGHAREQSYFKPLIGPLQQTSPTSTLNQTESPTSYKKNVSLTSRSGFVTTSLTAQTHLVGVHHPENYETRFLEARKNTFDGPEQQSMHGWTTHAGPRYAAEEKEKAEAAAAGAPERLEESIKKEASHEKAVNRWMLVKDEVQSPTSKTNVMRVFSKLDKSGR